jgi:hypothetical protein
MMPTKPTPTTGRLAKLLAETQANLDALQRVAALMNGHAKNGKVHRAETVLAGALKADAERRAHRSPSQIGKHNKANVIKRRARTARILQRMGKGPVAAKHLGRAAGSLVFNGYVKKQGDGLFVRTDKVFTP